MYEIRASKPLRGGLPPVKMCLFLALILRFACSVASAQLQKAESSLSNPTADSTEVGTLPVQGRTLSPTDADRIRLTAQDGASEALRKPARDETCLLPPLNLTPPPLVGAEQLTLPAKTRKEYHEACAALKDRKIAEAETHLRKAVEAYPKYSAGWVTLGQVLAAQQRTEEARSACWQASTVDSSYVPGYLCLADIAARAHDWGEVLKLSSKALDFDPANNAIAYEYNATANLNMHNLADAEKSGLRAVVIDKKHREPRVHFVLSQVYEAKGDPTKEAAELREYLKYANPEDLAIVKQSLSEPSDKSPLPKESQASAAGSLTDETQTPYEAKDFNIVPAITVPVPLSPENWRPSDIDEAVPPVRTDISCPLPKILAETSRRAEELVDNLQRFSASEHIEHIEIGKNGKPRITTQEMNYIVQIDQTSSDYPSIEEYRSGGTDSQQPPLADTGTAAFALIFHPSHIGNFDVRCEGLTEMRGAPAWQVHFEERPDPAKAFHAMRIGGSVYLLRFKGRAWISTETYEVLRMETDLVSPIPKINLQLEHLSIVYAPVDFPKRHVQLWLPESASLYIGYRGRRYERVHRFSQFQLFWVDSDQAVKEPIHSKDAQSQ